MKILRWLAFARDDEDVKDLLKWAVSFFFWFLFFSSLLSVVAGGIWLALSAMLSIISKADVGSTLAHPAMETIALTAVFFLGAIAILLLKALIHTKQQLLTLAGKAERNKTSNEKSSDKEGKSAQ